MEIKRQLRDEAKAVRASIPASLRKEKSAYILQSLIELPAFQEANRVFCFVSFRDEVETRPILDYLWANDKRVFIPYIHQKKNVMHASELCHIDELEVGYFGVMEQKEAFIQLTPVDEIDLVITPGLLFDLEGYRVGYGGGYFDGFFASFKTPVTKIGICFQEQIRTTLPRAPYDIPVDWIVTDQLIYHPAEKKKEA